MFLGDWHHVRVSTENNVLNVSYALMSALAKECKVYCILGNHDLYMKNSTEINSLVFFKELKNVLLIDKPFEISINGNSSLFVPWLGDILQYSPEQFDMLFGHFDIPSNFLVKQYVNEHSNKQIVSKNIAEQIKNDDMLNNDNVNNVYNDNIGNFVDITKQFTGVIFSGHIHNRKEFIVKNRKIIFVGSPYQQNLGEKNNKTGFYVIDESNNYEFHEIQNIPKHVDLRISDIVKDFSKFDFKIVKGNIVHKIYDVEIDNILDAKISQCINDMQPYEELLPDYEVNLSSNIDINIQNSTVDLIKKSKLDYIKTYIFNIDEQVIKDQKISKDKLYSIMSNYFNNVTEEK